MAMAREMEMIRSEKRQCVLQKRKKNMRLAAALPIQEDIAY